MVSSRSRAPLCCRRFTPCWTAATWLEIARSIPAIWLGTDWVGKNWLVKSIAPCISPRVCLVSRVAASRSEEHTSELQSLMRSSYAVFCLKKKNNIQSQHVQRVPTTEVLIIHDTTT